MAGPDGGAGWQGWMAGLDGGAGWQGWMAGLNGGAGWRGWMVEIWMQDWIAVQGLDGVEG
ncbi:MAG TPA: hypothetical protein VGU46_11580 [Acidobacteriaceae bacterium]|nr:hypothetical protein [Acidobacteriaceae bacterium]